MQVDLKQLWTKISRIGLLEDEGVHNMRNVIFLNRLLAVILIVATIFIFVEISIHGITLLPMILILIAIMSTPLILHSKRKFRFAAHITFYALTIFIFNGGLIVGQDVDNNVTLIPNLLVAVIIFKSLLEKIWAMVFIAIVYLVQYELFNHIEPQVIIPKDVIYIFRPIFYMLALIFTFFAGYYIMVINREYETVIVEQKETLEEKNKEITDSIKYAKRIQSAILPSDQSIKEHLPNSFVLYKPKDIVAGDFYWMEIVSKIDGHSDHPDLVSSAMHSTGSATAPSSKGGEQNIVLIAAADCTGHGVPGAMVSVVCNNGLNRSVREFGLTDPGKILDKTRELVIKEFEKSEEEVKDGMDLALVSLARDENQNENEGLHSRDSFSLCYSGAHNPLWIIRKDSKEIEEIKADKQPIGKFDDATSFTTHRIDLNSGDSIYIFSDGYVDQFGGEKGKKLKSKNFKNLLLSICHLEMEDQQKKLDEFFENWRGEIEQIDDVCVIGVRV